MTPSRRPSEKQPESEDKPARRAPLMRQLDRAAGEINPLLVIFVLGLGILDLTCYVGLAMSRGQQAHGAALTSAAYRR